MSSVPTKEATSTLSEQERAFIELDRKKAEVKKFFDDYRAALEALVTAHGLGHFFQDEEGVVYATCAPEGTFIKYERFGIERTRREGEAKGTLSLTKAREAGFVVEGK